MTDEELKQCEMFDAYCAIIKASFLEEEWGKQWWLDNLKSVINAAPQENIKI